MSILRGLVTMGAGLAGAVNAKTKLDAAKKKSTSTSTPTSTTPKPTPAPTPTSTAKPSISPLGTGLAAVGSVIAPTLGGFIKGGVETGMANIERGKAQGTYVPGGGTGGATQTPTPTGSSYNPTVSDHQAMDK